MATWKLSGEAGKALDATQRTLDSLNIENPVVTLVSQAVDKLTFRQVFSSPSEASGMELGQKATLWRDTTRFFTGNITDRKSRDTENGGFQVDTTISGPWWWLEQTPLSGDVVDGAGKTVERMQYAFAEDDIKTSITTLINRGITLGCPIQLGTISNGFDIPQITIPNSSCADALAELMRWIPDAVAWFDYSVTTGTGHPALNVTRRTDAATLSLAAGAAPVAGADINPRLDLEVDQVRVMFAQRNDDEEMEFVELSSGHSGTAQAGASSSITLAADASDSNGAYGSLEVTIDSGTGSGQTRTISAYDGSTKAATVSSAWTTQPDATSVYTVGSGSGDQTKPARQIVPISGPEISDILPKDYFDNETVKTKDLGTSYDGGIFWEVDPYLHYANNTHGVGQWAIATDVQLPSGTMVKRMPIRPRQLLTIKGEVLPSGHDYYLIKGERRPWFEDLGHSVIQCKARATLGKTWYAYSTGDSYYDVMSTAERKFVFEDYNDSSSDIRKEFGYHRVNADWGSGRTSKLWVWYDATVDILVTDQDWSTETTVYRQQDYGFVNPPADLAKNLVEAQNWIPHEGNIRLKESAVGAQQILGKKVNLTNSLPEHATMGALPNEVEIDIQNLSTVIYLGAPHRLSYKGLVGRFRQASRDNIIYI